MPRPNSLLKRALLELKPGDDFTTGGAGPLALYAMLHRVEKITGYRYDISVEEHVVTCREEVSVMPVKKKAVAKKTVKKGAKKPMNKKMC